MTRFRKTVPPDVPGPAGHITKEQAARDASVLAVWASPNGAWRDLTWAARQAGISPERLAQLTGLDPETIRADYRERLGEPPRR